MDMKCQTPQQLQLHHQHLQYQHQQQHQHHPNHQHQHSQQQHQQHHHNGNERMLTTPSSLVAAGGGGVTPPTSSAATTTPSPTSPPPPPAPLAAAPSSSSSASGGKGSCNNHSSGVINKTTLLNGGSGTPEPGRPLHTHQHHSHQQHQHHRPSSTDNQQSNVCGPGPPGPQQPPPHPAAVTSASGNNNKSNGNSNNELTNGSSTLVVSPTSGTSGSGGGAATLPHALLLPNASHTLPSISGRIALGECSLHAGGSIDWPTGGGGCGGGGIDDEEDDDSNNNDNAGGLPTSMSGVSGCLSGVRVGVIGLTSGMSISTAPHHQLQHHHHHHINNNHQAVTTMAMPTASSVTRKLPLSSANCALCCQPICDRYIMRVVDTSFHEGCLKCATCSLHLVQSCFTRDGKLYCRIDYERLFMRNRCLGCGHKINSDELVMRTLENVFHLKCFACVVCGCMLKKGEQYVVKQGQLFCRFDYEKEVEMLQGYGDFYGDDLFPPKLDGRRGPKRPRTILNTQQRRAFKASFEVSPKPCRKVRENLAKETGLSLRIVQVWFQNQRAKVKKIQKKAKQEHPKGHSDSQDSQESDSSCLAKIKDEAHSDTESLLESSFVLGGGGVSGSLTMSGGAVSGQSELMGGCGVVGVGGKLSRCIIKDEHENTSFNCMETNKENCNKTNEPILNTILGLSYATFQQLMGPFSQSPMINPIDRLYSMQNSYFRPDESMGGYSECSKDVGEL